MKITTAICCVIAFFAFGCLVEASAGAEEGVIRRYNYSSPQASWDSLQQALLSKDLEGVVVHLWQITRNAEGSIFYKKSFDEAVAFAKTTWVEGETQSAGADSSFFREFPICVTEYSPRPPNSFNATNVPIVHLRFLRSKESATQAEGVTTCDIEVEDIVTGMTGRVLALSFGGNQWWILAGAGD